MPKGSFATNKKYTQDQQFERVRAHLYHGAPVIGSALADLPTIIHEETIPGYNTAWVDGKNIHWDLQFFLSLSNEERMFIYAHEILHWLLGHFWRQGNRNQLRCNIAMDYAINSMLVDDYPNIMHRPDDTLYDSKYRGLSFEQIYEMLPLELDRRPQPMSGQGAGQMGDGSNGKDPSEQGWGHHDAWGKDIDEEGNATPAKSDPNEGFVDLPQTWNGKLVEAMNFAKQMGKVPAGFARAVGPLLNPVLPLKKLLLPYLSAGAVDYTMQPTDRRFTHANMFLPSPFDDENIEDFVACFDTSGSITDEDIQDYNTEMYSMLRMFPRMRGWAMFGDAAVANVVKLDGTVPKVSDYQGGGGTDLRIFIDECEKRKIKPKVMLLFTDTYGTWHEKGPRYPHITISSTDEKAPWGKTIKYVPRARK
jgi:predicted metal-dependent peptidase